MGYTNSKCNGKANGKIRKCGDYRITVNPVLVPSRRCKTRCEASRASRTAARRRSRSQERQQRAPKRRERFASRYGSSDRERYKERSRERDRERERDAHYREYRERERDRTSSCDNYNRGLSCNESAQKSTAEVTMEAGGGDVSAARIRSSAVSYHDGQYPTVDRDRDHSEARH